MPFRELAGLIDLNTVVCRIRNVDPAGFLVYEDPVQITELPVSGTFTSPGGDEVPFFIEDLDGSFFRSAT